ncbi:MAG: S-adenosylmethionine:tRNA ribosyltransferase-isomerase, partial [Deltaproteobacteria bacterium]|nr:S-adenosylmethionine:tRNA ribosyltransferase-isomerase [Deltaproteobacteria bacterium]
MKVCRMNEQLKDYDYAFPEALVAQEPLPERGASRMMVLSRRDGAIRHSHFRDLPESLSRGDLVIANDTSVLSCRLYARKSTGGKVEIFLLRRKAPLEWSVFLSPARGLKEGERLPLFLREGEASHAVNVTLVSLRHDDFRVRFASLEDEKCALEDFGEMPLPPYIERAAPRAEDRLRYQTVFARNPGAVAAPTAGLHFTPGMR